MSDTSDFNGSIIDEFRANGGKVGGMFEGAPMVLVHHKGAKSGTERVNPLMYQDLGGGSIAVFASKGGAPTNPDWYHNLVANPDTRIELGTEQHDVRARVADDDERQRIWEAQKAVFPQFAEYEKTSGGRTIPVVILERA
jgi:deazaflavin-dependent oxidoreductase (nitroreductase family)